MRRLPPEHLRSERRIGDEFGRISCATLTLHDRNGFAGHGLGRGDDFLHAEAAARAEIDRDGFAAFTQVFQSQGVRAGEIANVNVIADAGAVRRGVIRAKDGDVRALATGGLQDEE